MGADAYYRIAPQGRGHTHRGSAEARSEQLVRNTPDPLHANRDSKVLNQKEHEDPPERIFGGGWHSGGAHDPVQPGGSGGKLWCSGYAIVRIDYH